MTYADILRPSVKRQALLYDATLILAGSLLIGLSARLAIRLPFSPVPITGQTLAVLLAGALLGSRRGALSVLAYLGEGVAGLPVFAGGAGGIAHLAGPTGGYLAGFVLAALVVGWLAERGWDRHPGTTALAMLLGSAAIYVPGLPWLAAFVGGERALVLGLYPFLAGDLLKLALAAALLPIGWKVVGAGDRIR
jgi:biotin transport system substrate-specific component